MSTNPKKHMRSKLRIACLFETAEQYFPGNVAHLERKNIVILWIGIIETEETEPFILNLRFQKTFIGSYLASRSFEYYELYCVTLKLTCRYRVPAHW